MSLHSTVKTDFVSWLLIPAGEPQIKRICPLLYVFPDFHITHRSFWMLNTSPYVRFHYAQQLGENMKNTTEIELSLSQRLKTFWEKCRWISPCCQICRFVLATLEVGSRKERFGEKYEIVYVVWDWHTWNVVCFKKECVVLLIQFSYVAFLVHTRLEGSGKGGEGSETSWLILQKTYCCRMDTTLTTLAFKYHRRLKKARELTRKQWWNRLMWTSGLSAQYCKTIIDD